VRTFRIIEGGALKVAQSLPGESVQTVVTSPPYFGLRSYDTHPQVWGGLPLCNHKWGEVLSKNAAPRRQIPHGDGRALATDSYVQARVLVPEPQLSFQGAFCEGCRAWRGELGAEPTPALYVEHLVGIFREVRRVLRADGTCWLNIGDSYCSDNKWGGRSGTKNMHSLAGGYDRTRRQTGVRPKNLFLIPFRVALALQDDGWIIRSSIIWNKPNATPEPVKDRPAVSHEYLFLLAKSTRYYYDAAAVKEPVAKPGRGSGNKVRRVATAGERGRVNTHLGSGVPWQDKDGKRHRRTVWTVPTRRFPGAHFATFPEQLIEPCILAGSRPGDVVFDPFSGSGTTAAVSIRLGRNFIGAELNPDYVSMAHDRVAPLLNTQETAA
jgi:DNA modification methylase